MRKVMILLAVLLTANVMMAQKKDRTDAFMYNKNGQYAKAMASIEKCVNHDQFMGMKPNDQSQAWLYRAAIYQNIIQSGDEALMAQAPNALEIVYESLMNCMKNPDFLKDAQIKQEVYQRVGNVMNTLRTLPVPQVTSLLSTMHRFHIKTPSCCGSHPSLRTLRRPPRHLHLQ